MKNKLLIVFSLVIILFVIIGCLFSREEQEDVIIYDMTTPREGVLSNGRKFIFYGTDPITVEQYMEDLKYIYDSSYDFTIQEETVEDIFERLELESELYFSQLEPSESCIVAVYFSESKDVLISIVPINADIAGFPSYYGVNHESGVVSLYKFNWDLIDIEELEKWED